MDNQRSATVQEITTPSITDVAKVDLTHVVSGHAEVTTKPELCKVKDCEKVFAPPVLPFNTMSNQTADSVTRDAPPSPPPKPSVNLLSQFQQRVPSNQARRASLDAQ